jgi:hypothetical protein
MRDFRCRWRFWLAVTASAAANKDILALQLVVEVLPPGMQTNRKLYAKKSPFRFGKEVLTGQREGATGRAPDGSARPADCPGYT